MQMRMIRNTSYSTMKYYMTYVKKPRAETREQRHLQGLKENPGAE